jgi:hypothetical protein
MVLNIVIQSKERLLSMVCYLVNEKNCTKSKNAHQEAERRKKEVAGPDGHISKSYGE